MNDYKERVREVHKLTEMALEGPLGLVAVIDRIGPLSFCAEGRTHKSKVMRGIAERVLPESWEWDIAETIDGKCEVVVRSIG